MAVAQRIASVAGGQAVTTFPLEFVSVDTPRCSPGLAADTAVRMESLSAADVCEPNVTPPAVSGGRL